MQAELPLRRGASDGADAELENSGRGTGKQRERSKMPRGNAAGYAGRIASEEKGI